MIASPGYTFEWHGKAATLYVLRNDGYCWGRLVDHTGKEFDVLGEADLYDCEDSEAFARLADWANDDPTSVSDAHGWRGFEFDVEGAIGGET
jgi:hypothetical protein